MLKLKGSDTTKEDVRTVGPQDDDDDDESGW